MDAPHDPGPVTSMLGAPSRAIRQIEAAQRPFAVLCWAILILVAGWDVVLALDTVDDNTWSEVMRHAAERYPVLPWLLGAYLTHLFHPVDDLQPIIDRDAGSTLMGVGTTVFVAIGFAGVATPWPIGVTALIGMGAALLLWPRTRTQEWHW